MPIPDQRLNNPYFTQDPYANPGVGVMPSTSQGGPPPSAFADTNYVPTPDLTMGQPLGLGQEPIAPVQIDQPQQGLGLGQMLRHGLDAITPSRDTLGRIFMALEAGGAAQQGRTPLFMQLQDQQNQMQMRRDLIAQQAMQAEESKRQHNMGIAMKLIETGNLDGLMEFGNEWEPAKRIAMAVSKKDLAELPGLVEGGYVPKEFAESAMNDQLPPNQRPTIGQIQSKVKFGLQMKQKDDENDAKNHYLETALNTPPEKQTFSQKMIVQEHQSKLDKEAASTDLIQAQAANAWLKNPDEGQTKVTQTMNGLSLGLFGKNASEISPDEMLTDQDRLRMTQHGLTPIPGPVSRLTTLSAAANVQVPTLMAGNRAVAGQTAQLMVPDKPGASQIKDLIDDASTLERINSLGKLYDQSYVGPVRGRYGAMSELIGGIGEDEADFRAEVSTLKNQVIKQITGAQMSEPEANRIMKQIPDAENPPVVFEARLKRTRENVLMMAKKRREILRLSGIDVSHLPSLPGTATSGKVQDALDKALGK